jgi:hypothetical protein
VARSKGITIGAVAGIIFGWLAGHFGCDAAQSDSDGRSNMSASTTANSNHRGLKNGTKLALDPDEPSLEERDGRNVRLYWGEALEFSFLLPPGILEDDVAASHLVLTGYYERYSNLLAHRQGYEKQAEIKDSLSTNSSQVGGQRTPLGRQLPPSFRSISRALRLVRQDNTPNSWSRLTGKKSGSGPVCGNYPRKPCSRAGLWTSMRSMSGRSLSTYR